MAFIDCEDELWRCIDEIAAEEGLGVYDLEVQGQPRICVVVERLAEGGERRSGEPVKPSLTAGEGVTSDDCARLCRRLMVYFHAEGPRLGIGEEPQIDVSSPGVNRQLRLNKHFEDAVGERVKVIPQRMESAGADAPAGPVVGKLLRADGSGICVLDDSGSREVTLAMDRIKKARVEFEFPF